MSYEAFEISLLRISLQHFTDGVVATDSYLNQPLTHRSTTWGGDKDKLPYRMDGHHSRMKKVGQRGISDCISSTIIFLG